MFSFFYSIVILTFSILNKITCLDSEGFKESLKIQPLTPRHTAFTFQFDIIEKPSRKNPEQAVSYNLLRRSIAQIITYHNLTELHLTFTRGRWDEARFGAPMDFHSIATPGVEIAAWMHSNKAIQANEFDNNWRDITSKLAGLFCASLHRISSPLTSVEPNLSFSKQSKKLKFKSEALRVAHLVEDICTENLTPWIKLLPCRAQLGIASLLVPKAIYDSSYHSMSIDITPICLKDNCDILDDYHLKLQQRLTVVIDTILVKGRKGWNINNLFKSEIKDSCPLANHSSIEIYPSPEAIEKIIDGCYKVEELPYKIDSTINKENNCIQLYFDTKTISNPGDISLSWRHEDMQSQLLKSKIKIERRIVNLYNLNGEFEIELINLTEETLDGAYLQNLPWILQPYLHTLRYRINEGNLNYVNAKSIKQATMEHINSTITYLSYQPAQDRIRGSSLELKVRLQPRDKLTLQINFRAKFLSLTEYHPDSQRGFSISSGIFTLLNISHKKIRYYTTPLVLFWPTPDFSMPYNVTTFTCTIFALLFGSIFNSLTRNYTPVLAKDKK